MTFKNSDLGVISKVIATLALLEIFIKSVKLVLKAHFSLTVLSMNFLVLMTCFDAKIASNPDVSTNASISQSK